jgi:hypothetical protein
MLAKLSLAWWVCVVAVVLVACGGEAPAPPTSAGGSTGATTAPTTLAASASPSPECPNPEGGECLGKLEPGTYTTVVFTPTLTYTVPDGWSNFEDTPGNFLLVPARGDLPGVNAGTSDFVGVYSSVAAPKGCSFGIDLDVDPSAAGMSDWAAKNPGLAIANRHDVAIGGLQGQVLDLRMANHWTKTCSYSHGEPNVPLLLGTGFSGLEHGITPVGATRLYLLDNSLGGVLAIEVFDVSGGDHLDEYSDTVRTMLFAG